MFHKCKTEAEIEALYEEVMDLFSRVSSGYEKAEGLLKESRDLARANLKTNNFFYETDFHVRRDDKRIAILGKIAKYAHSNPKFDITFTLSVYKYLKKNGYITASQFNSLVKVYNQFGMGVDTQEEEIFTDEQCQSIKYQRDKEIDELEEATFEDYEA